MSLPSDMKREIGALLSAALRWFRLHWRPFVGIQILLFALIWLVVHPHDHEWLQVVRREPLGLDPKRTEFLAGWLSHWGDFPGFNVFLALGLWLAGLAFGRPYWKRLALMTVLCAALAGITTNIVRFGLGRSRPHVKVEDKFYGPKFSNHYQSCPSGHTTTAFAASLPLIVASPPLGVATTLIASSVGWSRMYLNRHYPADVGMGIWVALWFALPLGFAVRERRVRNEPPTN